MLLDASVKRFEYNAHFDVDALGPWTLYYDIDCSHAGDSLYTKIRVADTNSFNTETSQYDETIVKGTATQGSRGAAQFTKGAFRVLVDPQYCAVHVKAVGLGFDVAPYKPSPVPPPPPCSFEYRVNGSAPGADVTYQNSQGNTEQETDVALPWTTCLFEGEPTFAYVSAQNSGDYGTIVCSILADGTVVSEGASSGAFAICEAHL